MSTLLTQRVRTPPLGLSREQRGFSDEIKAAAAEADELVLWDAIEAAFRRGIFTYCCLRADSGNRESREHADG